MMQTSAAGLEDSGDRAMGHAGRVAARGPGDDLGAQPAGPDRELLDGRGAERVGGAQDHFFAVGDKHLRQLGDARGLAATVHAGHHDDRRAGVGETNRRGGLGQQDFQLFLEKGQDLLFLDDPGVETPADFADQFLRRLDAHIGADQRLEPRFQKRLIHQAALALEDIADIGV